MSSNSHSAESSSHSDDVSLKEKLAYGMGALPHELAVTGVKYLGNPIFNIILHLSPVLVGNVFIIIRIWDAFTDPFLGNLSDNTRSKWGRRKPYILFGAIGSGIIFTLIWWVPKSIYGNAQLLFWYFLIFALIHYTFVTAFQVPYNALGYEMSSDYHGRTRVFAYRAFFAQIAKLILPWLFFLCQLEIFNSDAMVGVKWVAGTAGVIIILFILPTILKVKEGSAKKAEKQERVKLLNSIGLTLKNSPFRILVFLTFVTIFGSNFALALGYYVNIYYVFDGDTVQGAKLVGVGNTLGTIVAFASIPILTALSAKIGKIQTLGICIAMLAIGSILSWWLYTPENPYLQLYTYPFMVMGDMGFWLFITSMKADICDWDEWKTGLRREGMYGAASGWFQKMTQAITFGGASYLLVWIGFDAVLEGDQTESTLTWMRLIYAGLPAILAILGIIALKYYPMNDKKAAEIQTELKARRAESAPSTET
ncbi:MAG: MFS transporter [Verrucomicrobia bacterium]|nr:MFS transporter [Verrucomicrobiota bacterium]